MEKMLGVMLDCSRNAVVKVDTVKQYADIIKKMGYNTLMLYTEDTYEVNNQPFFGHLRGRYSKEELKDLDAYCKGIGIELIPCIQTLAHLETMFKWEGVFKDVNDCDNILLAGEEKTYQLIEDMISTLSECISSKKIHIGMDEAYRVGTGKYQQINGIEDRFDVINKHLHKVCEIAEKYGLESMIWSDMFLKLAMNTEDQYEGDDSKILEKAQLPESVTLVYWDYYGQEYDRYKNNIEANKKFGRNVYFAGGAWTWKGFAPDNALSLKTTEIAMRACRDCGVDGILITVWGDEGAECSKFSVLPSLMYAAEAAKGNTDLDSIKKKFKEIVGCDFDSFMLLDKMDQLGERHDYNPCKYLLYNDFFMGIRDFRCAKEDSLHYKSLAEKIRNAEGKGQYAYIFDSLEKLADALSIKADLGIRTRAAYLAKDMAAMKEIIKDYDTFLERLIAFHKVYQVQWFKENKPHGFDVQDIRLGALMQRTKSCKQRLVQFTEGTITEIPELDEPVLDHDNGTNGWARMVTPNIVSVFF